MQNPYPSEGGSYEFDSKTGEFVLIPGSRTMPAVVLPLPIENQVAQVAPVAVEPEQE